MLITRGNVRNAGLYGHGTSKDMLMNGNSDWVTCGSICQGASHYRDMRPCQDRVFTHSNATSGFYCILLADGAGSARFSQFGAEIALASAAVLLEERFDDLFRAFPYSKMAENAIVERVQSELVNLSKTGIDPTDETRDILNLPNREEMPYVPCELRELASTLLAVAVKGERYVSLHIGDGVIGVQKRGIGTSGVQVLSKPENGEFANETYFTISGNASEAASIHRGRITKRHSKITGFILMSDGSEASLLRKRDMRLAGACGKLLDACSSLPAEEMQEQLDYALSEVIAKRTQDDCSIVLMARRR